MTSELPDAGLDTLIDVSPVPYLNHGYKERLINDLVDDPIYPLSHPVPFLPRQFFAPRWPRVVRQRADTREYELDVRFGIRRRSFDTDFLNASLYLAMRLEVLQKPLQ